MDVDPAREKAANTTSGPPPSAYGSVSAIGDGSFAKTGTGLCTESVDCASEPANLCAGWIVVVSRRSKKQQATGASSQQGTQPKGKPSTSLSASNARSKEVGALRARGAIGRASHRLRRECPFSADHRPRVN